MAGAGHAPARSTRRPVCWRARTVGRMRTGDGRAAWTRHGTATPRPRSGRASRVLLRDLTEAAAEDRAATEGDRGHRRPGPTADRRAGDRRRRRRPAGPPGRHRAGGGPARGGHLRTFGAEWGAHSRRTARGRPRGRAHGRRRGRFIGVRSSRGGVRSAPGRRSPRRPGVAGRTARDRAVRARARPAAVTGSGHHVHPGVRRGPEQLLRRRHGSAAELELGGRRGCRASRPGCR